MTRRPSTRNGGQVLVLALLGIVLLAGIIFYVVNVGDQTHRRIAMQNAADSAAISGATWMARSMNLVAMNNVAQTRMLALVPVLDAFPLSAKMAHEEIDAWVGCLDAQIRRGVRDQYLRDGLQVLADRMRGQRDILAPIDGSLNPSGDLGRPIWPLTTWYIRGAGGPAPHGQIWQAADSLDNFSQATAASAGVLAQADAVRFGRGNYAETAFVVPVLPELPCQRTTFDDFQSPVKRGRIPDHAYPQRLGPYDRLFKWRHYQYHVITEPDRLVAGNPGHGAIRGGSQQVNLSGRTRGSGAMGYTANPNPHWTYRVIGRVLMGYTVYGPYQWMLYRVHNYAQGWTNRTRYSGALGDSFFHEYHRKIADTKLKYMWQPPTDLDTIHYPQWHTDYPAAKAIADDPAVRVARTMFYKVEIRSKYPKSDSRFLRDPGTYRTNMQDGKTPIAMWVNGWRDPAKFGIPQIDDYIWEEQWDYETTEDWDIAIHRRTNPLTGEDEWQKVYMVSQWVFGGIDVGGDFPVSNPSNYSDKRELPAPILLDTSGPEGDYDMSEPSHDLGVRRNVFTYLGVAKQVNTARVWQKRFVSGNPFGVVAMAQAEIFNTRSWDLWTQDWKAQLVPVSLWNDWLDRMELGVGQAAATGGLVDADEVDAIYRYASQFTEQLAEQMLEH